MAKLRDRNRFIPNGFRYYQPETKWEAPRHVSFDSVVNALIAHRKGNPWLTQQNGWSVDFETVANEVETYNVKLCQQMGWTDFIMEGGAASAPPFHRPLPHKLKNVAAGVETLVEWIDDGAEAVNIGLATTRAAVCAACPKNGKGDFTRWFTVPVSEAIRSELNRRREMKLETVHDEKINVCEACLCPLKLKIHMPIDRIRNRLPAESLAALDPSCWIPKE
jgi:hypothetical protein